MKSCARTGAWRRCMNGCPTSMACCCYSFSRTATFARRTISGVAVASVVPALTGVFRELSQSYLNQEALIVDAGVKTGVRIRYENPRDVGADRVVDCAAVQHKYGGPACVVDFGTATTFDAISRGRGIPGRSDRARHRHCGRGAVRTRFQALPGGDRPAAAGDRHQHGAGHAIGHLLWLRGAGGRAGGALPPGTGRGYEGDRNRWPGGESGAGDECRSSTSTRG